MQNIRKLNVFRPAGSKDRRPAEMSIVMRTLLRLVDLSRRAAGWFPLTPTGLILAIGAVFLFRDGAVQHQDLLLAMAIPVLGAVLITAFLLTVSAAVWVRLAVRQPRTTEGLELEVDVPGDTGYQFRFSRWFPLVECTLTWDIPAKVALRREGRELVENVIPERRGVLQSVRRSFRVRDCLGLAKICFTITEPVEARVLPARRTLDPLAIPPAFTGGDELCDPAGTLEGDLVDMRRYEPGDPPRLILWKTFARTRRLIVRRPEPALRETRKLSIWFVPGPRDEDAASAVRAAIEQGLLGNDWLLAVEGQTGEAQCPVDALDLLTKSAAEVGEPVDPYAAFRDFAARAQLLGSAGCIILGPASRRDDLELLATSAPLSVEVVMAGATPLAKSPLWRRLLFVAAHDRAAVQGPIEVQTLHTAREAQHANVA